MAALATLIGLPLTLVGVALTWHQARRASTLAEATQKAIAATQERLRHNHLLVLLPQLAGVERDIDRAVGIGSVELASHYLSSWRWQVSQVRGILEATGFGSEELLVQIQESILLAAETTLSLKSSKKSLPMLAKPVQLKISAVTDRVGALAGQLAGFAESGQ